MSFFNYRKIYPHDDKATLSSLHQKSTEFKVFKFYKPYLEKENFNFENAELQRSNHVEYLIEGLEGLPHYFSSLDASKPWLIYWITHGLDLLDKFEGNVSKKYSKRLVNYLKLLHNKNGGFCGGFGQIPHLAPTYASVNAIAVIGSKEAYEVVDVKKLYSFLLSRKDKKTGGFTMHDDGEVDIRGAYCALSCAVLYNILTPELAEGVTEYIVNCQTFEGGLSALPLNEAHGGYAFCGLAALMFLKKAHLLNVRALVRWCVKRQMSFEGGFQGRTNKLVDSCYSFWMGGNFPLLNALFASMKEKITKKEKNYYEKLSWKPLKKDQEIVEVEEKIDDDDIIMDEVKLQPYVDFGDDEVELLMHQSGLQQYIVLCCQDEDGGMRDKPEKNPDFYHTCYSLSGLSVAQHNTNKKNAIFGKKSNLLNEINPLFNLRIEKVKRMIKYFGNREEI